MTKEYGRVSFDGYKLSEWWQGILMDQASENLLVQCFSFFPRGRNADDV